MVKAQRLREKYDAEIRDESGTLDLENHQSYSSNSSPEVVTFTMNENTRKEKLLQELENDWDDGTEDEQDDDEDVDEMFGHKLLKTAKSQPESEEKLLPDVNRQNIGILNTTTTDNFSRYDNDSNKEPECRIRKTPDEIQEGQFSSNNDSFSFSSQNIIGRTDLVKDNEVEPSSSSNFSSPPAKPAMYMPRILTLKKNKPSSSYSSESPETTTKTNNNKNTLEMIKSNIEQGKSYFIHSYRKEMMQKQKQQKQHEAISSELKREPIVKVDSPAKIEPPKVVSNLTPTSESKGGTFLVMKDTGKIIQLSSSGSGQLSFDNKSPTILAVKPGTTVSKSDHLESSSPMSKTTIKPALHNLIVATNPITTEEETVISTSTNLPTSDPLEEHENGNNSVTESEINIAEENTSKEIAQETTEETEIEEASDEAILPDIMPTQPENIEDKSEEIYENVDNMNLSNVEVCEPMATEIQPELTNIIEIVEPSSSSSNEVPQQKDEKIITNITAAAEPDKQDEIELDIKEETDTQAPSTKKIEDKPESLSNETDSDIESPVKKLFPELKTNFKIPKKRPLDAESLSKLNESTGSNDSILSSPSVDAEPTTVSPLTKKLKKEDEYTAPNTPTTSDQIDSQKSENKQKSASKDDVSSKSNTRIKKRSDSKKDSNDAATPEPESDGKDEHMRKLKLKAKIISKKLQEDFKKVLYYNFENRIQSEEILSVLQNPNPNKVCYSKISHPKPGEFYVFSYPHIVGDDNNCDNLSWRNKGVKFISEGEKRIKKIYFGNVDNPLFKKKLSYFEDPAKRKYLCVYYEEAEKTEDHDHIKPERPADNAILYKTNVQELRRDEIIRILTQPDADKIAKTRVKSPRGGDVLVFSTEHLPMTDYRCDSYTWQMHGLRDMAGTGPVCKRIHYSISLGKGKHSNKFRKKEYYFVDESLRKYVLVHYLGDETIYVPHSHGNSKYCKKIYQRTCPSLIAKIKHMAEISKPSDEKSKKKHEGNNGDCQPHKKRLKTENDLMKENTDALKYLDAHRRLSTNDIYNLNLLAFNLNGFIHCLDVYPNFICVLGLEELLIEFNKLLEVKTEKPLLCIYDKSYKFYSYYVTPLFFQHVALDGSPVIPLAFLLHQEKREKIHCRFLQVIIDHMSNMSKTMIPVVLNTDQEVKEAVKKKLSFWPILFKWKSISNLLKKKLETENIKSEEEQKKFNEDLLNLLHCETEEEFTEASTSVLKNWSSTLKAFYNNEIAENISEHAGRWVMERYGCYNSELGIDLKTSPDFEKLMKDLQNYKLVPIDVTIIALFLLHSNILLDLQKSVSGNGTYKYIKDFLKDLATTQTEKKGDDNKNILNEPIKSEDIITLAEEYSTHHLALSQNMSGKQASSEVALTKELRNGPGTNNIGKTRLAKSREQERDAPNIRQDIIQSLISSSKLENSANIVEILAEELKSSSDKS